MVNYNVSFPDDVHANNNDFPCNGDDMAASPGDCPCDGEDNA
jgi:hypothetical protein